MYWCMYIHSGVPTASTSAPSPFAVPLPVPKGEPDSDSDCHNWLTDSSSEGVDCKGEESDDEDDVSASEMRRMEEVLAQLRRARGASTAVPKKIKKTQRERADSEDDKDLAIFDNDPKEEMMSAVEEDVGGGMATPVIPLGGDVTPFGQWGGLVSEDEGVAPMPVDEEENLFGDSSASDVEEAEEQPVEPPAKRRRLQGKQAVSHVAVPAVVALEAPAADPPVAVQAKAVRKARPNELCQGCGGLECFFSTIEAHQKARVQPELGGLYCMFCDGEILAKRLQVQKGFQVTKSLVALHALDQDVSIALFRT